MSLERRQLEDLPVPIIVSISFGDLMSLEPYGSLTMTQWSTLVSISFGDLMSLEPGNILRFSCLFPVSISFGDLMSLERSRLGSFQTTI